MLLKFQQMNKIKMELVFPFLYMGGMTSKSDLPNISCSHQGLGDCHSTDRVNSRMLGHWSPSRNTAVLQCLTESIDRTKDQKLRSNVSAVLVRLVEFSHLKTVMVPNQNTSDCPSMETSGDKGPTLARCPLRLDRAASMYSGALSHSLVHSPFHMDQIRQSTFPFLPGHLMKPWQSLTDFFFLQCQLQEETNSSLAYLSHCGELNLRDMYFCLPQSQRIFLCSLQFCLTVHVRTSHVDKWCRYGQRSHMVYIWMKKWDRSKMCSEVSSVGLAQLGVGRKEHEDSRPTKSSPFTSARLHDLRMDFTFFNSWEKIKRNLSLWNL